jgi:hypothetical protein
VQPIHPVQPQPLHSQLPTKFLQQAPVTPFPMPIMKVIKSPPLFSQNITIQRTNIKPAELTKMGNFINPPHLLGNQFHCLFLWI